MWGFEWPGYVIREVWDLLVLGLSFSGGVSVRQWSLTDPLPPTLTILPPPQSYPSNPKTSTASFLTANSASRCHMPLNLEKAELTGLSKLGRLGLAQWLSAV